ncbi:ArgE/DapE family deacylase [bacterium]|nr:ArgE/DapE family deacylase [bacterium]
MTPAAYVDTHADDLVDLLRRLVRLPTVNPPGDHYDAITRLLAAELQIAGLAVRRPRVPTALIRRHLPPEHWQHPRWNVLGRLSTPGAGKKTVHFNAHYDVVPVSGNWRHGSPFSGVVEDGWIYGRGTSDMKGAIASLLLALRALRATRTQPALNVEVSFTADEETDSALGAGWVVEHGGIRPDYALVLEGGEGRKIGCGHNGVVWLEITVQGRAAHGSTPDKGINALEHAARLVLALGDHARTLASRTFTAPDGTIRRPTLNVGGVFSGGTGDKINTVPALARFSIDRRVLPNETVAAAERELRAFLATATRALPAPRPRIEVRKVSENHPCFAPPDHPFAIALASHVAHERRCQPAFSCSTGFNDMHFFWHHLGVPTLGYGPGGDNYHAVDERAAIRELLASARIYAGLLTSPWPALP